MCYAMSTYMLPMCVHRMNWCTSVGVHMYVVLHLCMYVVVVYVQPHLEEFILFLLMTHSSIFTQYVMNNSSMFTQYVMTHSYIHTICDEQLIYVHTICDDSLLYIHTICEDSHMRTHALHQYPMCATRRDWLGLYMASFRLRTSPGFMRCVCVCVYVCVCVCVCLCVRVYLDIPPLLTLSHAHSLIHTYTH